MYLLRLFHQSDPTRQIDSRTLSQGELLIGRDPTTGWRIDDPDRQISRAHCTLQVRAGELLIRDTSANGVILARTQSRLPHDQLTPLNPGESLLLGKFTLTVELTADEGAVSDFEDARPLASDSVASPFSHPGGDFSLPGLSKPKAPDPFASELKRGALDDGGFSAAADLSSGWPQARSIPQVDEDAWERREPGRVGDWNGPSAHRAVNHETLVGSPGQWAEPESSGPPEIGFGFDAPFHRPILRADPIPPEALIIPSDWDVEAAPEPAPRSAPEPVLSAFDPPPEVAAPAVEANPPPAIERPFAAAPFAAAATPTAFDEIAPPKSDRVSPEPEPSAAPARSTDGHPGLRAFCEGANLDPSEFAGEDPEAVLRRAGAIYQQMVLGLTDLLSERTSLKNEYRMARTTVAPEGNNPFKWTPARRLGVDLLRASNEGFMGGPPAVRESFEDLKKHLLCLLAGMRASIASTLKALSPSSVEHHLKKPSFGLGTNRGAAAWSEYARLHAEFQRQADDNPDSQINRDFRSAYEQQLGELDGQSARR